MLEVYARSLEEDLRQLRDDHNVTLLLNLLNESELRSLGVSLAESPAGRRLPAEGSRVQEGVLRVRLPFLNFPGAGHSFGPTSCSWVKVQAGRVVAWRKSRLIMN